MPKSGIGNRVSGSGSRIPNSVSRIPTAGRHQPGIRTPQRLAVGCALTALLLSGCAYYNTFYNAQTLYRDGVKLVEANNKTAARDKFEKAIKKSAAVIKHWPKSEWVDDALLLAAMSYYQEGEYTKAIVKFENFAAAFPESPFHDQARLYHALSLIGDEQYVKGIQMLTDLADTSSRATHRTTRAASPVAVEAAYQLAVTALRRNEYADAITALQDFMTRHPHDPKCTDAGQLRAEALFHEGQYLPAIRAYAEHRRLTQHGRDRTLDDLQIAECYLRLNQSDSVLAILQRQADKFPEYNDRINLLAGKAFLSKGKPNEAIASLTKVRSGAEGAEACLLLGRNCEQDTARTTQHLVDASAWYDSAKTRDPSSTFAQQAAQRSLLITRLIQLTKGTADTAESHFLLAEIYHLNMEQDSQAVVLYQKVADTFPTSPYAPKALYAIAWIKQQQVKMRAEGGGVNSDSGLHPSSFISHPSSPSSESARSEVPDSSHFIPRPDSAASVGVSRRPSATDSSASTARTEYLLAYQDVVDRYPKTIYAQEARKTLGLPLLPDWEIEKPPPPKVDTSKNTGGLANDSLLAKRTPGDTLNKSGYSRPDTGKVPQPVAERPGRRESARERHGKALPPGGETTPGTPPPSRGTVSGKNGGESHADSGTQPPAPAPQHPTSTPSTPAPVTPPPKLPAVGPESLPRPDTGKTQVAGGKRQAASGRVSADSIPPQARKKEGDQESVVSVQFPSPDTRHPAADTDLKPVYFAFDRSMLRVRDTLVLRANLDRLLKTPGVAIEVNGYCDPRGSDEYNDELGLRRAEAVKRWLVAHGVGADRIRTNSYGSSLVTTDDPAFYWQERRSEIRVRAP